MAFTFQECTTPSIPGGSGSTVTITPASIAVGDLVIVTFQGASILTCDSVIDTLGNTYNPVAATFLIDTATSKRARTFYSNAAFGGASPTVTGAYDVAAGSRAMFLTRYSLTNAPAVLDGEANGNSGSVATASPMDSGPLATTGTDLLYGFNAYDTNTPTQPAGWTNRETSLNIVGDDIGVAPGTYHYQPTFAGTNIWAAEIVAFHDSGGVATVLGGSL